MKKPDEELRDELHSLSPLLESLHQNHREILTPPAGYFDKLPDETMSKIKALSPSTGVRTSMPARKRPAFPYLHLRPEIQTALAFASLALLIFAGVYLLRSEKIAPAACAEIHCLNPTEVQDYVQHNIHYFPLDIILEAGGAEAALNGLFLPVPSSGNEDLSPLFNEVFQQLNPQEYESLF